MRKFNTTNDKQAKLPQYPEHVPKLLQHLEFQQQQRPQQTQTQTLQQQQTLHHQQRQQPLQRCLLLR